MTYLNCGITVRHPDIPVQENGRKFRILNAQRSKIIKVQVDGCVIKQRTACDYLFDVKKNNTIYYVELKGKNILKAVEQLIATMEHFKEFHENRTKEFCLLYTSPSPRD